MLLAAPNAACPRCLQGWQMLVLQGWGHCPSTVTLLWLQVLSQDPLQSQATASRGPAPVGQAATSMATSPRAMAEPQHEGRSPGHAPLCMPCLQDISMLYTQRWLLQASPQALYSVGRKCLPSLFFGRGVSISLPRVPLLPAGLRHKLPAQLWVPGPLILTSSQLPPCAGITG